MGSERFPPGDLAALRRQDGAASTAFWRVLVREAPELAEELARRDDSVEDWSRLLAACAALGVLATDHGQSWGAAMRRAGVTEGRLERFLRSPRTELRPVARLLAAKGQQVNPGDVCGLLFSSDPSRARDAIARDYYLTHDKEPS